MANIVNQYGQVKLGVRYTSAPLVSTLWGNVFGVWNGETLGTSLDTSIFRAYNGEIATITPTQLSTNIFGVWNGETLGTSLDTSIHRVYNGDDLNDTSGNSQNGTNVNGVTFTTGKVGNAFTFNGSNYVTLPNNSLNFPSTDFTISAWVNLTNITSIQSILHNYTEVGIDFRGFYLIVANSRIFFRIENGDNITNEITSTSITTNAWTHIVITRKASTRSRMYVNGILVASDTSTVNPTFFPTMSNNYIGAYRDSNGFRYISNGGKVDAVNVWTKELTAGEIINLYNGNTGAEYPFSSQTLATYNDAVGTNHGVSPSSTLTGGVPGPSFTTGKIGKAFTFDGVNDFVALPNSSFDFTGDFSISAWVKIPANPSGYSVIFSNYNYDVLSNLGYNIGIGTDRKIYFGVQGAVGGSSVVSTTVLALNTWYHITVKRDSVAKRSDLYINGVFEAQATNTNLTINYGTRAIQPTIGGNRINNQGVLSVQNYLNGSVDALTIWNKVLTNDEVSALYNSGNGQQYPFSSVTLSNSMLDSVNAQNGTNVNNVTLTTGKVGNAFTFNGSNYIQLPNSSNQINFTTDFSFSFWVYIPSISTATNGIFANYTNVGGSKGFIAYLKDDGKFEFLVLGTNGTSTATSTAQIPTGWTHIAVTRKMITSKETYIYINGVLNTQSGINNAVTLDFYSTTNPSIGAINSLNTGPVQNLFGQMMNNSKIDGLTVWNKVLTAPEITQLYNGGSGAEYPFSTQLLPSYNDAVGSNHGITPATTNTNGVPGPSFTTGKIGKAFNFDGVNDYIELPNNTFNSLTGDFSISLWFFLANSTSGFKTVVSAYINTGGLDYGWELDIIAGVQPYFAIYGTTTVILQRASTFTSGWNHFVVTRKGSTGTKMYHNGNLVINNTSTVNPRYNSTTYASIGALKYGTSSVAQYTPNGNLIDALSVWNKELTEADITELYNSGNGKQYPN